MDRDSRESVRYRNVLRAFRETPWAILPSKLAVIRDLLVYRAEGHRLSEREVREALGEREIARAAVQVSGQGGGTVAVLPLYGVIMPRANLFTEFSGGTSLERLQTQIREAVNDPNVSAILIDVDSPGGMTDLVPETAAMIRTARTSKPITAIANTKAASAAYWLASQASELVVTPSGMVGSIGVFAAHTDISEAMVQEGIKTTLISAGRYKTEGNPYEPLSEEARAAIQATVDEFYAMFISDVAQGRGVAGQAVQDGYGQGRMVTATNAYLGLMVDRVATFEQTLVAMLNKASGSPLSRGVPRRMLASQRHEWVRRHYGENARPEGECSCGRTMSPKPENGEYRYEGVPHGAYVCWDCKKEWVVDLDGTMWPKELSAESDKGSETATEIAPGAERLLARPGFRKAYSTGR